jgi:mannose PTS system EIIA component
MSNAILIIAHAPLASALRQGLLHVFPEAESAVTAIDVQAQHAFDDALETARGTMSALDAETVLVLTDLFGATPCNLAQKLVDGVSSRLIAGVNLPMLLRAFTYRREPLDIQVARAMAGGTQGVMQVSTVAPQNQVRIRNDQDHRDHQQ